MKKLFLILLAVGFSMPVLGKNPPVEAFIGPIIPGYGRLKSLPSNNENTSAATTSEGNDTGNSINTTVGKGGFFSNVVSGIKNASGKVGSGIKTVSSKVGSGIKSGFGKVKDVLGLSAGDIEARKQERTKRKADRAAAKADAAAADVSMLESAAIAGDKFDNNVDAILESDEVTDPSAELESLEDDYRTTIENITAGKSGKYVNVINQDMETTINSARNLINKNPEKLKEFRNNATSVNRTNMIDKAITGVSTAAMGIGGMELAQGLSEQKADKEAASDMQGYLSGLYCTYSNKQAKYGVKGIKIDDENKLDLLREEFLTKAATLKYTKEQLGLKAGLESEVVFDDAATALYNNQGTSRGDSKFGRLSEAIMDETGSDAQIIAAQQEKSKNRVTGGAIAVVGGVAASIGGNALINSIGNKDKKSEKQQIEQESELVSEEEEQIEDSEQVTEEKVEKETENTDYVDSPVSVPDYESYQVNENLDNMT